MSTANIIRLVQTVLVAAVAAFAISVVVAGHWWSFRWATAVLSMRQAALDDGRGWGVIVGGATVVEHVRRDRRRVRARPLIGAAM